VSRMGMDADSKQRHVHAVFESIAPNYDLMNDVLSFRRHKAWRRFTMRKMDVKPGQKSLDLCCGTCDWTIALAKAMELPFPDNTFDFVTIGFGLRNVPDIMQVLSEMRRVVKPGGKIVCLELSKPTWQPFKGLYYFYFEKLLPLLGKWLVKKYEQYRWLPESLAAFPDLQELAERFRSVGMRNVRAYPLAGGIAALHIGTKGNDGA
jgi:demethylmenaquinone methyltransferase/2-methoxy-6-polyprenyl-1,4-benzoquinol methylase